MRSETKPSQDEEKNGQEPLLPPIHAANNCLCKADNLSIPIIRIRNISVVP